MKSDESDIRRRIISDNLTHREIRALLSSTDTDTKILIVKKCFIPNDCVKLALKDASTTLIYEMLNHNWIPVEVIESYLDHPDELIRQCARSHPKILKSSRLLRERSIHDLCPGASELDKVNLLQRARGDHPLHHQFLDDDSAAVRKVIAQVARSEDILERLALDTDYEVSVAAVSNPHFQPWSFEKLRSSLDKHQYIALLTQPWATPQIISEALWRYDSPETQAAVAQCRHLTPGQFRKLDLSNDEVRFGLANNPSTPTAILITLFETQNLDLIMKLCFWSTTEVQAIQIILEDGSWKRLTTLAEQLRSPRALQILTACGHVHVRRVLATSPHLSKETQLLLATDESAAVRFALAQNLNVSENVQAMLAKDRYEQIRAVIARSSSDKSLIQHLLHDASHQVRLAVACNPDLDYETAQTLQQSREFVRFPEARRNLRRQSNPRNRPKSP